MTLSDERRALLEMLIRGRTTATPVSVQSVEPRVEPASYAQRRLWFLEQVQRDQVPYTLHTSRRLTWAVDPALLERTVNEIARRHEILRTTFASRDGETVQCVASEAQIPLAVEDLRGLPPDERRPEAMRRMASVVARRFDLARGPLMRTHLYRLADRDWVFLVTVHHIVFDATSFEIFFSEVEAIYSALLAGREPSLPAIGAQYADFAREQRAALTEERVAEEVEFWRTELDGLGMLDLPLDRSRQSEPTFRGELRRIEVPPSVVAGLQSRATQRRATLFMVLLSGLAAALSRVCGQDDFAIGLPVTGRDAVEWQKVIGFFVDTIVVRCDLRGDPTMDEVVERIRNSATRSLSHRVLPFDMLVEHLKPARDLGINPFFQVGFQLMQREGETYQPGAIDVPRSGAMFDLGIDLWLEGKGLGGCVGFNTDLFDPHTIELILAVFQESLKGLLDPGRRLSELEMTTEGSACGLAVIEAEHVAHEDSSLGELISRMAEQYPDVVALEDADGHITYREMLAHAARLGHALERRGIAQGVLVALVLPRSIKLVCLELAVWQAGAAYVLLDPGWPEARREAVLAEAGAALTLDAESAESLWLEESLEVSLSAWPRGEEAAYVIFTSGSTGVPKGVLLEHAGLLNVAEAQRKLFGLGPGRRVAQMASPSFDASVFEIALALGSGATLVIAPPELPVGDELAAFFNGRAVDTIVLPPSLLATVRPEACAGLRLICVAGESCPADLAERWEDGREFWNLYGPTEATIWATYGCGQAGSRVTIGRPIQNMTTLVVDRGLRPVPPGVVGELCLAGVGLARGYLNHPSLTAERFVPDPTTPGRLMYRTGDLVRQLASGELLFLGRLDRQVKVRGFRIEAEEVETVLRQHPSVSEAVVTARADAGGEPLLVAYLKCEEEGDGVIEECRKLLQSQLPHYMMPSHFVLLHELPRSTSGKIDLKALPAPSHLPSSDDGYVEPSTPTERRVAELMARAAHASRVGSADDFFRIGGHSLAAAQLVAEARAAFKVELAIRDIFFNPTVAALAARIDALSGESGEEDEEPDVPLIRLPRRHETQLLEESTHGGSL